MVENKEETLAIAEYAAVQTITSSTTIATEQTSKTVNSLDKFTAYTELKPKFLEKESTLLEVKQWTRQARLYITAGYKTDPPEKGIFRYVATMASADLDHCMFARRRSGGKKSRGAHECYKR